jgi:hypothetical protein
MIFSSSTERFIELPKFDQALKIKQEKCQSNLDNQMEGNSIIIRDKKKFNLLCFFCL